MFDLIQFNHIKSGQSFALGSVGLSNLRLNSFSYGTLIYIFMILRIKFFSGTKTIFGGLFSCISRSGYTFLSIRITLIAFSVLILLLATKGSKKPSSSNVVRKFFLSKPIYCKKTLKPKS